MRDATTTFGAVNGAVRTLLRGEGLALLSGAMALYWKADRKSVV